jgi:hypothetical protein
LTDQLIVVYIISNVNSIGLRQHLSTVGGTYGEDRGPGTPARPDPVIARCGSAGIGAARCRLQSGKYALRSGGALKKAGVV